MKRMGWATGPLTVVALLLTACGSDGGGGALSEDDFVDELNSICSDASRDIEDLDPSDRNFFDDVLEVMQNSADDLGKLKPPKDLADDFNDFSDNLDDTIKATEDLRDAVDDEDEDAIADASDELSGLSEDSNDLADDLGADDCVDIGGGSGSGTDTTEPTDSSTDETTANTPLPIDTTVETTPETSPETTEASSPATTATAPATSEPMMTVPAGTGDGLAQSAADVWQPPAGFEWDTTFDISNVSTPFEDPVVGPVLAGYWAGLSVGTTADRAAIYYISEGTAEYTPEQLDALLTFEGFGTAPDTTTPLGFPARIVTGVGDEAQYDAGVMVLGQNTVAVLTLAGEDVAGLLDEFFTANSMGG